MNALYDDDPIGMLQHDVIDPFNKEVLRKKVISNVCNANPESGFVFCDAEKIKKPISKRLIISVSILVIVSSLFIFSIRFRSGDIVYPDILNTSYSIPMYLIPIVSIAVGFILARVRRI